MSKRQEDRHWAAGAGGMNEPPAHPFSRHFDMADAMARTRSEYVGLARQDALDAASDAGLETRVLDMPVIGDVGPEL